MRRQAELRARFTAPNRRFRAGGPGLTTTMINVGVTDVGKDPFRRPILDELRWICFGANSATEREISTNPFQLRTQMFKERRSPGRLLANIVIRVELSD
jgi:hypothetical protein